MGKPTVDAGGESEQERFTTLIRQHYQALYRAAYRLTRSVVDAEDLVQEVCVRAYPRLGEVEQLEHPRGWLLRVLYRLFVDLRRRYKRKNVRAIDEEEEFASSEPSPAEEADRALDRGRIEDAWQHLSQEQRLLLAMHDVEGYSLATSSTLTGLKDGTIKSRLHRARVGSAVVAARLRASAREARSLRCDAKMSSRPCALPARSRQSICVQRSTTPPPATTARLRFARSMRCRCCATSRPPLRGGCRQSARSTRR